MIATSGAAGDPRFLCGRFAGEDIAQNFEQVCDFSEGPPLDSKRPREGANLPACVGGSEFPTEGFSGMQHAMAGFSCHVTCPLSPRPPFISLLPAEAWRKTDAPAKGDPTSKL